MPWSDSEYWGNDRRLAIFVFIMVGIALGLSAWAMIGFYTDSHRAQDPDDPIQTYVCRTYNTWNERNYAAFVTEHDGHVFACWEAGRGR